jgi:ParB family transcriptional regulator, chromosome partitioning protein
MDSIVPQQPKPWQPTPLPVEEFDDVVSVPPYVAPDQNVVEAEVLPEENLVEQSAPVVESAPTRTAAESFFDEPITPNIVSSEVVEDEVVIHQDFHEADYVNAELSTETVVPETAQPIVAEPFVESMAVVEDVPTEKVSYADSSIQEINISDVVANPYQPRTQFKPEALQELANSIKEHGVIQPLVVTKKAHGYEIVVGERRFRASQLAGLTKVPAIVKSSLHDQTKLEVALIENTQRQDLNAIEEARGYDRMLKEFNLTQDQVAKKVGKSRSAVANTLRLLNLPAEIQRGVIDGKITEGHARAILGLGDIEKMILMYQTIQDQGLNVRQVEAKVREITVKRRIDAATPDPKLMAIETELRGKLGAQVKIQRQGRGGKVTIDFFSDEDLDEIIHKIAEQQESEDSNYLVV